MTDGVPVTPMPTITQEEFIKEHKRVGDVRDAHPIDEDILKDVCDTKMGPILIEYDLAMLQAIATRNVLELNDEQRYIEERDGVYYFQVDSATFYDLLARACDRYDNYVEAEDMPDIVEVHTRQYLRDMHGYEGDFGGQVPNDSIDKIREPTLCNAQNDDHSLRDEEPEDAHYAFTDGRGLVVEKGTHDIVTDQHALGTMSAALDNHEHDDWDEDGAVSYLTMNFVTDEERAEQAFERYQDVTA